MRKIFTVAVGCFCLFLTGCSSLDLSLQADSGQADSGQETKFQISENDNISEDSQSEIASSNESGLLNGVKIENADNSSYDRDNYPTWDSVGPSCWSVRDEVLKKSIKSGTGTTDGCKYISGTWEDPYSGEELTFDSATAVSRGIQIDHIIPLHYVNQHGGASWSAEKKEDYANNYDDLVAVGGAENEEKSDQGPAEWMPNNKNYWCTYSERWAKIATKWGISVTNADYNKLKTVLNTCN
ncbi:MAG: HNH endonuclease family protein [Candidatus Ancillula sp.]|jgi:hypothetical protein|nr:HNH endonuclease family protein [Candidatus Ancillula sp.]